MRRSDASIGGATYGSPVPAQRYLKAPLWTELGGPLLALGTVAGIELLHRALFEIPNPPALLLLVVVFSAFTGGLRPGLFSAAIAWAYFAYFFSIPKQPFHYTDENLRRVIVWAVTTPSIVVMVGLLKNRTAHAFRRVAERTAELELANGELEAFSYSVAHNLRAPLRAIDGFSHAVLESSGAALDTESVAHLQRVRAASQHMDLLIDELLNLSRLARIELRREPIDLSSIASSVATELQSAQPSRSVTLKIARDCFAKGDPFLLRLVLSKLLGNAWKFTSKREDAMVEFGVCDRDGIRAFFVRDNGAGFDMAHANKLFGIFQRLHRVDEFEGNGIGLATVQRVVRRHGGRIWAESQVGQGATFFFTLEEEAR